MMHSVKVQKDGMEVCVHAVGMSVQVCESAAICAVLVSVQVCVCSMCEYVGMWVYRCVSMQVRVSVEMYVQYM